jgi:hypothetical protein
MQVTVMPNSEQQTFQILQNEKDLPDFLLLVKMSTLRPELELGYWDMEASAFASMAHRFVIPHDRTSLD